MVWIAGAGNERAPIASVHLPNGNVELVHGFNSPNRLVVVSGLVDHPVRVGQLLEPTLNRSEDGLALGVIGPGFSEQDVGLLGASLDALFVVPAEEVEQVARSLALAITTPGEPDHPWCCDWNDMRSLVADMRPYVGRSASARAVGPFAAQEAANTAVGRVGNVANSRVLSMLTGPQGLRGAQIKEASAAVRSQLKDGEHIAAVLRDPSMPEDTAQVDIFVFGPAGPRSESAEVSAVCPPAAGVLEIPAYLRGA